MDLAKLEAEAVNHDVFHIESALPGDIVIKDELMKVFIGDEELVPLDYLLNNPHLEFYITKKYRIEAQLAEFASNDFLAKLLLRLKGDLPFMGRFGSLSNVQSLGDQELAMLNSYLLNYFLALKRIKNLLEA